MSFLKLSVSFILILSFMNLSFATTKSKKTSRKISSQETEWPWTTWSRKKLVPGLYELLKIREKLSTSVYDVHEKLPNDVKCPHRAKFARLEDGTCNDLKDPAMGGTGVSFGRNVPLKYITNESEKEIFTPDPRLVSRELMARKKFKPVDSLNLLITSWLQFMNHDWFSHGENEQTKPYVLDLAENDEFHGQRNMMILRSAKDTSKGKKLVNKTFSNKITHWWDGSQIYGSDLVTANKLRSFKNGELKLQKDKQSLLTDPEDGIELTGFKDNWWIGLSMLHTLFVLEHNSIAKHLKKNYPTMGDQQIFDKARLVNSALMAKIHATEWTPAILNNPRATYAMKSNWYGPLNPQSISGRFSEMLPNKADWNIASHPYLSGILGAHKDLRGVPYSITEEFVAVYRMHPLLPESVEISDLKTGQDVELLPLAATRKEKSPGLVKKHGLANLFYSFGLAKPGAMTLNNYPEFLRNLDMPVVGKMDLAAVDIIRDRERGVPRYNQFRRLIPGLKPIKDFQDLFKDPENDESKNMIKKLRTVYQNDIEKLDLLVGSLAEEIRPTGFGFGETSFHIFTAIAPRRLEADRFFTVDYRPEVYSKKGLQWVDKNTMKSVLLRHYPELNKSLDSVKDGNAFFPWGHSN